MQFSSFVEATTRAKPPASIITGSVENLRITGASEMSRAAGEDLGRGDNFDQEDSSAMGFA